MDSQTVALFIVISFFLLSALGFPIAFVLGLTALFYFIKIGNPIFFKLIPHMMVAGVYKFPLLAVPFFIMAGAIMNKSGITKGLVNFSNLLVGNLRAGLAYVNIVASILFAGISGSAVADTSALGSILIPAMEKDGYDKNFSAAVTAASSIIGPIIPPSIIAIIYAYTMGLSIGALFAAGILPGIFLGLMMGITVFLMGYRYQFPRKRQTYSLHSVLMTLKEAIFALLMPLIILGGIFGGIFTATEASAIAVFYAFVVGFLVTRTLKFRDIPEVMKSTAITSSVVYLIIATSSVLQWIIGKEGIGVMITQLLLNLTENKYVMMCIIGLIILIIGMFMDTAPAIIIFAPLLSPIALKIGMHPLHFGAVMTVGLSLGLATPPLGMCLFVACGIADIPLTNLIRSIFPFLLIEALFFFVTIYFPVFTVSIPKLMGYI